MFTDKIKEKLNGIEEEFGVKILYAVESGSRAWGFDSKDSDWDVRFLYVRPSREYSMLSPIRDVIDQKDIPIEDDLDFEGWDIQKALKLFYKGNPSLLEWLKSPIVYREPADAIKLLQGLAPAFFRPRANMESYLHMASGNYKRFIKDKESVRLKKYLYVVRPILCCLHIQEYGNQAPLPIDETLGLISEITYSKVREEVHALLAKKRQGQELGEGPPLPTLNAWIETMLDALRFDADGFRAEPDCKDTKILEILMALALREIEQQT